MQNLLKTTLLLFAFGLIGLMSANAQKIPTKELIVKVGDANWKSSGKNATAEWDSTTGTLTITAVNGNEKIIIQLKSQGGVYSNGFTKGGYAFARNTPMLDNYSADATYIKGDTEWKDNDDEDRAPGMVEITEITATGVKGKFSFDLTRKKYFNTDKDLFMYDKTNMVSVTNGSFDLNLTTK